ncbi:MAG: hypothetical protein KJ583_02560 [Nanoarchaeota archaeon]|nr:hypothetical protein [Nanoarchaeota archaeon]MBU1269935.1 hypothetical protein [Nanoarchaeota archaeon]MBU1604176.1 hypothetical protein [Nanoarchaeota archaeon]MBU2443077.1 hypothetical protein [Nanoarchaeota archaeon]
MMKKGEISLLVTLTITVIFLILVFIVTLKLIGPLLWNEKNSVSYENYKLLTTAVESVTKSKMNTSMQKMVLQLEPGFDIIAFDPGEGKIKTDIPKWLVFKEASRDRPDECETNKGCLCIYKGGSVIECKSFEKTYFFSELNSDMISQSMGEEKKTHTLSSYKYEGIMFFGDLELALLAIISVDSTLFGVQPMYVENYRDKGNNYVLISNLNNKLLKRFKMISKCPTDKSDGGCNKYQHYDEVFNLTDSNGKIDYFVCKFNEKSEKCVNKSIELCAPGMIDWECACGDTAYEFGMCINEGYYDADISSEYCFINKFDESSTCKTYEDGSDAEQNKYACTFNRCGVKDKCYWNNDDCEACEQTCLCKDYGGKDGWIRFIDPCDCDKDKKPLDTDDCLNCQNEIKKDCKNYLSENQCIKNGCFVSVIYSNQQTGSTPSIKGCIPEYSGNEYKQCVNCLESCDCKDYVNAKMKMLDLCDCDKDRLIGESETADGCQ